MGSVFGGRKAFGFIFLTILGTGIEVFGPHGLSQNFVALVTILFGTYATGNVISKKLTGTPGEVPENGETTAKIEQTNEAITKLREEADYVLRMHGEQIAKLGEQGSDDIKSHVDTLSAQIETILDKMGDMADNMSNMQKRVRALSNLKKEG